MSKLKVPFNKPDLKELGTIFAIRFYLLIYGEGDFNKTLDISTRAGQDSDCNPATAMGILATKTGFKGIPEFWLMGLEDIENIKKLNLDLLIRGGSGILQGNILNTCPLGIISFHHGDNRWNRGSPPAFWEVYFKKPSTGFIIQILMVN